MKQKHVFNLLFSRAGYRFYRDSDSRSSRRLFRFSLLHLPAVIVLMLISKKYSGDTTAAASPRSDSSSQYATSVVYNKHAKAAAPAVAWDDCARVAQQSQSADLDESAVLTTVNKSMTAASNQNISTSVSTSNTAVEEYSSHQTVAVLATADALNGPVITSSSSDALVSQSVELPVSELRQ